MLRLVLCLGLDPKTALRDEDTSDADSYTNGAIGQRGPLDRLHALLGSNAVVLLNGEPQVGKSSLLDAFIVEAKAMGKSVFALPKRWT